VSRELTSGAEPGCGAQVSQGGLQAKEDTVRIEVRPALQILQNGVSDFLGQWQAGLPAVLSRNQDRRLFPVEVGKTKIRHITGAKSQP